MSPEQHLRLALKGTSETAPRPISRLELPLGLDKIISAKMLHTLKPASVLTPVVKRKTGLTVLFTKRSESLRRHGGQISFPGGRREPDDASAAAAALRETHEEVGIPPESVEVIGYLDDYPTITRYLVTPVVGLVEPSEAYAHDEGEVAEVFEVPLAHFLDPASFLRKVLSKNGVNVPFFEIHHGERVIWGATAGMLWNLHQKLLAVA